MNRRAFLTAVSGSLLAAPLAVQAQQATGQRHRVGLLNGATGGPVEAAFREGLHALGYAEGTNLVIDARAARGRVEHLPILMRELLDAKPEVIVTFGTTAGHEVRIDISRVYGEQLSVHGTYMGSPEEFDALLAHTTEASWRPVIDSRFPLEEVPAAYRRLDDPERFGKIVIRAR